ncbi:hypothetical protein [Candidatus Similichlamydia epinepheli]|uniref:hypothetical protein n=1 Tax=Candidatus Similichlamydia epinepheli TaxID=1903953 RepID=UPI000D357FAE|nr:hypothetical protein [Candidatus Similichlamydia epinepheli]
MSEKGGNDPITNSKRIAVSIVIGCGICVSIFCFGLFYFYGKHVSLTVKGVLTSPQNLSQIRATYRVAGSEQTKRYILNKIEILFSHERGPSFTRRLFPEEYSELFSWIQDDKPLSKTFSGTILWEDTAASIRLFVSSVESDYEEWRPIVYQEIEFAPDGSLFRISRPKRHLNRNNDADSWIYYHHPGILKMVRKKFYIGS